MNCIYALWDELWFVNMGYTNKIWLIDWLISGLNLTKDLSRISVSFIFLSPLYYHHLKKNT